MDNNIDDAMLDAIADRVVSILSPQLKRFDERFGEMQSQLDKTASELNTIKKQLQKRSQRFKRLEQDSQKWREDNINTSRRLEDLDNRLRNYHSIANISAMLKYEPEPVQMAKPGRSVSETCSDKEEVPPYGW